MYQNILRLEGIMVLLVLCGVALRRRKLITDEGQDCLTDLMTTLILPCNIFLSFPQQMDLAMLRSFFLTILISVLVMAASALLGRAVYGRREEHESKVFQYGLINSNAMFIGVPVIQNLLGAEGVVQQTMYMIFVRMFCWSYALSLYTGVKADWRQSLKKLLVHPCMIAAVLGLAVMLSGIQLPEVLLETAQYLSDCMMALSMLLIGVVLSENHTRALFRRDVWGFALLRLVALPALVLALCRLCRVPQIVTATCTLLSGMPAASLTAVLAARYRGDAELGSMLVAVSTALSMATIVLWALVLHI